MAEELTTHKHQQEEEEEDNHIHKPKLQQSNPSAAAAAAASSTSTNAFAFWAYLTLAITLLTILLSSLHTLLPPDETTWFLSLPADLRRHYSSGKLIKAHLSPNNRQVQIFAVDRGPKLAETLFLLHGLASSSFSFRHVIASLAGRGLRVVAIDFPGSGFSEGLPGEERVGFFSRFLGVYKDVREKGLFWGFDQLVEKGHVQYEEKAEALMGHSGASRYGQEEVGGVVGRVIDELGLAQVHLVLHDSAVGPGTWWAGQNPGKVRSVIFMDSSSELAAFPVWMLGVPLVREVVLSFRPLFRGLLRLCCTRNIGDEAAEAYRMMLKGKGGHRGVVEFGKALNYSFDWREWAGSEEMKRLPLMVLWSHASTDMWIEEGRRVSSAVPNAMFIQHFGGRWAQEDAAEEIAGKLAEFVLSLPKSHREVKQELLPEHIKSMFEEVSEGRSHRHHHAHGHEHVADHHHGHDHEHVAGFIDAYGLNHRLET